METLLAQTDWWAVSASWAAAIATVIYVVLTWRLLLETRRLRMDQGGPRLELSLESPFLSERGFLVLSNTGETAARLVTISLPDEVVEHCLTEADGREEMDNYRLQQSFPIIARGQRVVVATVPDFRKLTQIATPHSIEAEFCTAGKERTKVVLALEMEDRTYYFGESDSKQIAGVKRKLGDIVDGLRDVSRAIETQNRALSSWMSRR